MRCPETYQAEGAIIAGTDSDIQHYSRDTYCYMWPRDRALTSYALWEESWGIHTFTVSAVYAGLKAAEGFADFFGDAERAGGYGKAADEVKAGMEKYLYSLEQRRFSKGIVPKEDGSFELDLTKAEELNLCPSCHMPVYRVKR